MREVENERRERKTNEVFQQDEVDPYVDERDAAANEVGAERKEGSTVEEEGEGSARDLDERRDSLQQSASRGPWNTSPPRISPRARAWRLRCPRSRGRREEGGQSCELSQVSRGDVPSFQTSSHLS